MKNIKEVNKFMDPYLTESIPVKTHFDWKELKTIKIKENNEKLISLNMIPEKIIVSPQYFIQGIKGSLPQCYVREGAYDLLIKAADDLPAGYKFLIYDTWRPKRVQYDLYNKFEEELKDKYPDKGSSKINKLVEEYVALPSGEKKSPSPHLTGGAVDLTIIDENGKVLDMGTKFDETVKNTHTDYYELILKQRDLTDKEDKLLKNRRLLYNIMVKAGFTNYPCEWWHFDYGNQVWAYLSQKDHAIYSSTSPDLRWKKEY